MSSGREDSGTVPAELYADAAVAVRVRATRIHGVDVGVAVSTVDEADNKDPSTAARRFTDPILAAHEELLDGLRSLRTATAANRGTAAESLRHALGRYVNLVGTVVYPELDRIAAGGADDVAWVAERNAESALDILERLLSSDALDAGAVSELTADLCALIDTDDTIALPVLCHRLDDHDLDRLADAANEVTVSGSESTARSHFGSAPG